MSTTTDPITRQWKLGRCPACGLGLWADVDLVAIVGDPTLPEDGNPKVFARAEATAMRIEHACPDAAEESA